MGKKKTFTKAECNTLAVTFISVCEIILQVKVSL